MANAGYPDVGETGLQVLEHDRDDQRPFYGRPRRTSDRGDKRPEEAEDDPRDRCRIRKDGRMRTEKLHENQDTLDDSSLKPLTDHDP